MIVIDASAALEWLLRTSDGAIVERRVFVPGETLHAPHLIDVEVAQVLRRLAFSKKISGARGRDALADLGMLSIRHYAHTQLLPRVWELRNNLTAYDAVYVALAEALGAPLLTRDRRIAFAAGIRAQVELV